MKRIMLFCLLLCTVTAQAQLFKKLKGQIEDKATQAAVTKTGADKIIPAALPGINPLKKDDPITTSFNDVDTSNSLPPEFGTNEKYESLDSLNFGLQGYILKPGFFEAELLSYCIMPGTPSPTSGDGYMNAPLKGPIAEIVNHIVWNSMFYPKVTQREVQVLLWAIIAKTKFSDFSDAIKLTATTVLTPIDLLKLNGGLTETITDVMFKNEIVKMPAAMQQILTAENEIRKLVKKGENSYEAYEHWAVPAGMITEGTDKILKGSWTFVADGGYYVRYFPWGYRRNKVQVYMPYQAIEQKHGHGPFNDSYIGDQDLAPKSNFDPTANVSQPAKPDAQRLMQSPMSQSTKNAVDDSGYQPMSPLERFYMWGSRNLKGLLLGPPGEPTTMISGVRG